MVAFELQVNLETFSHPGQIGILKTGRRQMQVRMGGRVGKSYEWWGCQLV